MAYFVLLMVALVTLLSPYYLLVIGGSQVLVGTQSPSGSQCSQFALVLKGLGTCTIDDIVLSPPVAATSVASVGAFIHPQYPVLRVGNHINFSVQGENDVLSGRWLSGSGVILKIDMKLGMAEAMREGTTQVIFKHSNMELQTTVTVLEGNAVVIDAPMDMLTNAPFLAKGYRFPLKFSDAYISRHEASSGKVPTLYDCIVDPPFIGYAKPWKDLDSGISYCLFFPHSPIHLVRFFPTSEEIVHDIPVSISVFLKEANITASVSAPFIGGFSVLEMDENPMQLHVTGTKSGILTIIGNTDVEVSWSNRAQLIINCIHTGIRWRAQYEVSVLGDQQLTDKIIISLAANGQRLEIDVTVEKERDSWIWWAFAFISFWVACLCIKAAFE